MIGAIASDDLMASSKEAGELDGVLIGLSAAVGEKECVDIAGRDLGQLGAQTSARLGCHERVGIGQRRGLVLNGANHALIAMTNVDAHQLAVEVDEALPFRCPEIDALGSSDR